MSGEASGLILLPLAIGALPLVLGGLAVAGVTYAAVKAGEAAVNYEKKQRAVRRSIAESGIKNSMGDLRRELDSTLGQHSKLNIKTSEQMMRDLELQRNAMRAAAEKHDIAEYGKFTAAMNNSRTELMRSMSAAQDKFTENYRREAAESTQRMTSAVAAEYSKYLGELQSLKDDAEAKKKLAAETARDYISEAEALAALLADEFEGERYIPRELALLREQLARVRAMYDAGRYEAAVAVAKDAALNAAEDIYTADAARSEWENYYKLALVLSEEIKAFIEGQSRVTPEIKAQIESAYGRPLESDIVGIGIADYTLRDSRGRNTYELIAERAQKIYDLLRAEDGKALSLSELKRYGEQLNNEIYPAAADCISKAVMNMNNAFSRQNMSEELIDFFEEHNFIFSGYAYENDRHDEALHMGFENDATGEELIISLAPECISNGDIQTHVDIKQIKGDEANEERKAYYRQCVEQVVKGNNPYAKVDLKCKRETIGRLSGDTQTKKKLQN